jgi:acetyltransferase
MYAYVERKGRPLPVYRHFSVSVAQVRTIFAEARAAGRIELNEGEVRLVLAAYGLRVPESRLARSPDEAAQLGTMLGFPVVMKVSSPEILLKSTIGAVRVGVAGVDAARESFELIDYRARKYWPDAHIRGVLVQEQVRPGHECMIVATRDPQFGPLIALGLAGVYVEVMKDVVFRLAPMSEADAAEQVRALRAYPILRGAGGGAQADIAALEDCLLRVSQLLTDAPEIVEVDFNPIVVHKPGEGAVALDVRIILQ